MSDVSLPFDAATYSLIVPIYNEEAVLPLLFERLDQLVAELDGTTEVILVDDGSRDNSARLIVEKVKSSPNFRLIALSRNFGHQIAITAGMEAAVGQATIVMDADLQDPPEVALQLVAKWKEGYEIVYAQRLSRDGETAFKLATAHLFYWVMRRLATVDIPENVGDFRLVDRVALDTFLAMPERDRFVRGMFGWMGFRQTAVPFHRAARAAGETKYPFWKMLRLAANGVVGFSDFPLRLALWLGSLISLAAVLYGIYVLVLALIRSDLVAGWASIVVVVSFLSGINLLMLGIVGIYVGRIHTEVKRRPLYIVGRRIGFAQGNAPEPAHGKVIP
ncbi:MAG: glycosyltransferase family 2 protein [Ancalomicrobiaceae bacterium]|nr:glycosyltransferase family 2 protein [Ancalomicrobiaceae bacterium]